MKTIVGISILLMIATVAGCSSDDASSPSDSLSPMTVRLNVMTNPVGCAANVYWESSPDGMTGEMIRMTSPAASNPEVVSNGTTISVNGNMSCAVPGSSGSVDATLQMMVNGNWQDAPMTGTH
ncbi:MAG TPA: hypothetical protein VD788_07345, partial [Candidatus Polarisedimenticolaceae bacterium]|nr:hypothetical protein [Candidatus Polarisedimenticolaceae bacterium]